MLAVEHCRLQRKGVHPFYATEVHDILPRPSGRFAERVDATVPAEIVLRLLFAELVLAERTFFRFDMELCPRHEMHHRSPLETERAVAAYPMVMGSASNENWIAPQWQLPLNGCIVMFHEPSVFSRYYRLVKIIAMLTPLATVHSERESFIH